MNVVCRLTRSRQYEVNAICRQPLADDHTARVVTVRKRERAQYMINAYITQCHEACVAYV